MKILLATDGSKHSEGAARFLNRLNFSDDDEIFVFHAISWAPILTEWEYIYDDFRAVKEEIAPRILESSTNILRDSKARITSLSEEEYPDKAILTKADELNVDLIVLGARGLRGITSRIVGSTTKTISIKSSRPVLIIEPPQQKAPDSMKVLFATDGSVYSDYVINLILSIPFSDNTELVILNVLSSMYLDIPDRFSMEIDDRMKKIVADTREKESRISDEILEKASRQFQGKFSKIDKLTKYGDPPVEIINVADQSNADIIAVGSSGMRGIKGMIGSVSRYIINHAACSALIGKKG